MSRLILGFAVLALSAGCSRPPVMEVDSTNSTTSLTSKILRGHLVWGHEVRTFTECGSSETGWIIDKTDGALRLLAEAEPGQPYEKILVEIQGRVGPGLETGFGADFGHSITVTSVKRLPDGEVCNQPPNTTGRK